MATENIPINSGTGPRVAVDLVGTDNYQIVKVMQATDGATGSMGQWTVVVTGTSNVAVVNTPAVSISGTPTVTAANVTIASVTTGTVNVVNTVAISGTASAIQAGNWNIATITTLLGTVAVSGGGGGVQYGQDTTAQAATATGTVVLGIQSTTTRALALSVTGDPGARQVGTWNIATITTLLGTVAVSGGGGGVQYGQDTTAQAATATGTVILGIQSTTTRALALSVTGDPGARQVGTWNIATITTLLGTVAVSGGGGGVQYSIGDTSMAATGTGTLAIGMQTGATTGRGIAVTTTGAQFTVFAGTQAVTAANVTIASVTTGTMNVVNVLSASGITVASITTGTMSVVNVLSASGVTVASVTTGTVNVVNTVAISGTVTAPFVTTTASLAVIGTAHASRFQAYVMATTSAAGGVIIKTSGAHTLYITDILLSVNGPMSVQLCSETTAFGNVFLATNGGFAKAYAQPIICTSAQSFKVIMSSSGSCAVSVVGYTVT